MCNCLRINIPGTSEYLVPGCKIKLGRFESEIWVVNYGWFAIDGNRPFCGWFLKNIESKTVKPLLQTDLDDCYFIE